MNRVVVISGAGISAESGLQTFRGHDGHWEGHRVEGVASPEAWSGNPGLVLEFYNQRRRAMREARPNAAHRALVDLERADDVRIVPQNVDDLHGRASSTNVLHLHGEIHKARSTRDQKLVWHLGDADIHLGDLCERGSQLRHHIVWFGETIPAMDEALELLAEAASIAALGIDARCRCPAAETGGGSLADRPFKPHGTPES